jgi:hypothetical protein
VTRAAPALSLSVKPLNRVAARVSEMPRGPLSEDEAQHREAPAAASASDPAASSIAPQASVPVAGSAPWVTTKEVAVARIPEAAAGGEAFTFVQSNPKKGKSGERYDVCKVVPALLSGLKALQGINFPGTTRPVLSGGVTSKSVDFAHDVARGFVTFMKATLPRGPLSEDEAQ